MRPRMSPPARHTGDLCPSSAELVAHPRRRLLRSPSAPTNPSSNSPTTGSLQRRLQATIPRRDPDPSRPVPPSAPLPLTPSVALALHDAIDWWDEIQLVRIECRVPEYGWTTQKVFHFLNLVVNVVRSIIFMFRQNVKRMHPEILHHVLLELPGVLFFMTYALLVLSWAEIYYQARTVSTDGLRPAFYTINEIVYVKQEREGYWKMMHKYIGSDVTSLVTLPVIIFEPMSMLQRMTESDDSKFGCIGENDKKKNKRRMDDKIKQNKGRKKKGQHDMQLDFEMELQMGSWVHFGSVNMMIHIAKYDCDDKCST